MADRPLECSECRKSPSVTLIQVSMSGYSEMSVCETCPLLAGLLETNDSLSLFSPTGQAHEICCGNCQTTMESVQMGNPLGCANCYDIFADVICAQILKVPISQAIHCGRSLGEVSGINPTLRLYALNEALQETLFREEYEEAARIRDEINSLMQSKAVGDESAPFDPPSDPISNPSNSPPPQPTGE